MVQPNAQLTATEASGHIRCVECSAPATGDADGWRAYITGGFEGEPLEVITFCPECSTRELDGSP